MTIGLLRTLLQSTMQLPGVVGYFATSAEGHFVLPDDGGLSPQLVSQTLTIARSFLATGDERASQPLANHMIAVRRMGDAVAGIIANSTTSDAELHRKLNVLAIRAQVAGASEAVSPIVPPMREAYIAVAGPLSELAFDRAIEQLKTARKASNTDALRELAESLGSTVTPVYRKNEFLERAGSLIDAEEARTRGKNSTRPPSAVGPTLDLTRAARFADIAVIVQTARDSAGTMLDDNVVRALVALERDIGTLTLDRVLSTVAQLFPENSRAKFTSSAKSAIERRVH